MTIVAAVVLMMLILMVIIISVPCSRTCTVTQHGSFIEYDLPLAGLNASYSVTYIGSEQVSSQSITFVATVNL